jgi:hypothetical protein
MVPGTVLASVAAAACRSPDEIDASSLSRFAQKTFKNRLLGRFFTLQTA